MKLLSVSLLFLFTSIMSLPTLASMPYDKFPADPAIMAPDFQLPSLSEESIRLSDYKGKIVLLNFWATFCAPF